MNPTATGKLIAQKRREKNLTQEQLGEKLCVSNKTISKWENGKAMPDYSIIQNLCKELEVTVTELVEGETHAEQSMPPMHEAQLMDLLSRIQTLEQQRITLYGILLIVLGVSMLAVSQLVGGSNLRDFMSGLLLGLSIGEMLIGAYLTGRGLVKRQ